MDGTIYTCSTPATTSPCVRALDRRGHSGTVLGDLCAPVPLPVQASHDPAGVPVAPYPTLDRIVTGACGPPNTTVDHDVLFPVP